VVEVRPADPQHIDRIAEVFGRSFVTEPMMSWPLGGRIDDLEQRCIRAFAAYLEPLLDAGLVWQTTDGHGALVLVSPDQAEVWDAALARVDDSTSHDMTDDGGVRHERFWAWVESKIPPEPVWHLDCVGVAPGMQGRGIGSALINHAMERARDSGAALILETGTERNVTLYERCGLRIVEEADAPDGGPHVWFLRHDP
jgi:ribosomal protein S18 acetylase RimI-like enzyme